MALFLSAERDVFGFSAYIAAVLCFCCLSTTAFAAGDPLAVVNNLSTFIFFVDPRHRSDSVRLGVLYRWVFPSRAMTLLSVRRAS